MTVYNFIPTSEGDCCPDCGVAFTRFHRTDSPLDGSTPHCDMTEKSLNAKWHNHCPDCGTTSTFYNQTPHQDKVRQLVLSHFCTNPVPSWDMVQGKNPALTDYLCEQHYCDPVELVCEQMEDWELGITNLLITTIQPLI